MFPGHLEMSSTFEVHDIYVYGLFTGFVDKKKNYKKYQLLYPKANPRLVFLNFWELAGWDKEQFYFVHSDMIYGAWYMEQIKYAVTASFIQLNGLKWICSR